MITRVLRLKFFIVLGLMFCVGSFSVYPPLKVEQTIHKSSCCCPKDLCKCYITVGGCCGTTDNQTEVDYDMSYFKSASCSVTSTVMSVTGLKSQLFCVDIDDINLTCASKLKRSQYKQPIYHIDDHRVFKPPRQNHG